MLSAITVSEVFYGCDLGHVEDMAKLCRDLRLFPLTPMLPELPVRNIKRLKQQQEEIEIPALVISATAIAKNIPLATLNTDLFKHLSNIKIVLTIVKTGFLEET